LFIPENILEKLTRKIGITFFLLVFKMDQEVCAWGRFT
jgi:hypothetical protein